jgi:hypothetical protein
MNRRDAIASLLAAAGTVLWPRVLRAQAGFPIAPAPRISVRNG